MSTKTTFKRIALVAVAALGFGLLSVAPSSAAQTAAAGTISAINIAAATSNTNVVGVATDFYFGATAVIAELDLAETQTYSVALTSYPSSGYVVASGVNAGATLTWASAVAADTASGSNVIITLGADATGTTTAVTATGVDGLGKVTFTPSTAGDYVITIWNDINENGAIDLTEARQTSSVTIAAAAAANATPSATYSSISAWDATAYSKVAGTDAGTAETVTIKNTANAVLNGQTVRAVVTGPGTVTLGGSAVGRDVSLLLGAGANTVTLLLEADGNAGSSTVDVYAGTTKLLTTAAISFHGTLATLKVTANKLIVTKNTALTAALTISGLDADGIAVPLADDTVVGTSSDLTVLLSKVNGDDALATGVLTLQVVGANDTTTTSGRSATITWKYLITGTTYTPDVVTTFNIGAALNTLKVTLNKSEYAPGELITATFAATDALGNAASDATVVAASGLSSSISSQGLPNAAVVATVGGKATATFYAPAAGSTFTISAAYTDASAVAQIATVTATIVNAAQDASQAAADAAAEATDAANAATDAANAAAEAADAATAAAQDAADAVAALSVQVSEQIAALRAQNDSLRKQLIALTNLIIKIQKKVKA